MLDVSQVEQLLIDALAALARERPLFHSEVDLQLALAWSLQRLAPTAQVRLERRMRSTPRVELDVFVSVSGERYGIELKYPRASLTLDVEGEQFDLRTGAADVECYSAINDITRVERLIAEGELDRGCVLLITNNPNVWSAPAGGKEYLWDAFRLTEGAELQGTVSYRATEKKWPGQPITLRGRYSVRWQEFSRVGPGRTGTLRTLRIPVGPEHLRERAALTPTLHSSGETI